MGKKKDYKLAREKKTAYLLGKKITCPDINACQDAQRCIYNNCEWFEKATKKDKGFIPLLGEPATPIASDCQVIPLPIKVKKERETFEWKDEETE